LQGSASLSLQADFIIFNASLSTYKDKKRTKKTFSALFGLFLYSAESYNPFS